MTAIWSFPTRIVFGNGEAKRVGEEAAAFGIKRALVVTDAGVRRAELLTPITDALEARGIAVGVFDGIESNPTEDNVEAGAKAFAEHAADGLVAVGGGSPLDAAKLIAVRAKSQRPWEELDDAVGGGGSVPARSAPGDRAAHHRGNGQRSGPRRRAHGALHRAQDGGLLAPHVGKGRDFGFRAHP